MKGKKGIIIQDRYIMLMSGTDLLPFKILIHESISSSTLKLDAKY